MAETIIMRGAYAITDPRLGPNPEIWETYPRYSPIRKFPPPPAS